ncbi:hypothetical protein EJP82_26785 [Paenibacillus anaericanus]|uniref:Type II toxin-antitoxin system RelE/ParE family toxin n=1 Tax=Paenibacillus anaericanus TaxID=170367 RepID=A0A433XVK7_9BACL|nr:hypothetical protein [Paenibacillus anaericanus]RUT38722.1 hypothetical protein EJP82_26785 [Paenibacillus anaericanus]
MSTKILLHEEIRTVDFPAISNRYVNNSDALNECIAMIDLEIERIRRNPENSGAKCQYEPLSSIGFRKVKLFSSRSEQTLKGSRPDLRIIYRYDRIIDAVIIHTIAFRIKERPRPREDAYSIAESRTFIK